jgi:hypothetical protein
VYSTGDDPTIQQEDLLALRLVVAHASRVEALKEFHAEGVRRYIALLSSTEERALGDPMDPRNPMSLVWSPDITPCDIMGRRVRWHVVPHFTEEGPAVRAERAAVEHEDTDMADIASVRGPGRHHVGAEAGAVVEVEPGEVIGSGHVELDTERRGEDDEAGSEGEGLPMYRFSAAPRRRT